MLACKKLNIPIIKILSKYGVDYNEKDEKQRN